MAVCGVRVMMGVREVSYPMLRGTCTGKLEIVDSPQRRLEFVMLYPVECTCGKTQQIPATMAGGKVACECGLQVAIPSLSALKARAGELAMSAEVQIESLLQQGKLPSDTKCLTCGVTTNAVCYCWTTCERAKVDQPTGWDLSPWGFVSILFGFITFRKVTRERVEGRDLRFRLPLRICPNCRAELNDPRRLKETLLEVPLYARLLEKYPDADVSLDPGIAGLTPRER
jgi:hypothetical protein